MRRNNVSAVREKYDENHPVVSFRTSEPTYKLLKDLLLNQEKSIGEFFREALGVEQRSYEKAYSRGYKEGFKAAKEKYVVTAICCICDRPISVSDCEAREIMGMGGDVIMAHVRCVDSNVSDGDDAMILD